MPAPAKHGRRRRQRFNDGGSQRAAILASPRLNDNNKYMIVNAFDASLFF
jgi:hypothetical protein